VRVLRLHLPRREREQAAAGERWAEKGLVLCNEDGTPLTQARARSQFERLVPTHSSTASDGNAAAGTPSAGSSGWTGRRSGRPAAARQVVGHTPGLKPESAGGHLWCVDVGAALSGRMCALLRRGGSGRWRPVV
jgi:hypothetical protein